MSSLARCVVSSLFWLSAVAVGGTSMVVNPGFEEGLEGWRAAHAGYDDPEARYEAVADSPHSGKLCVGYSKPSGASKNNHFDQIVNVERKTRYTLSAWARSDGRLQPLLSVEDMEWKLLGEVECGSAREWHRVSLTFNSGDRSQVRLIWYGGSMGRRYQGFPGQSWLDDVELRPATTEEIAALDAQRRTDTRDWFEFNIRWDDGTPAPAMAMDGLHDPPAGKRGFVRVQDGHLHFADGSRARFWGVCLCGRAAFPTHEQADKIAARLVKCGVNLVRLHALEVQIFDPNHDDTRHLDPEMLDRLDYFFAQLKQRGIYVFMDWRTAWRTRKGDGLSPRWLYQWAMRDERFVELNQNYARLLYLHKNPYTGNRYVDEPAIAVFEIVNERDLFSVFTGNERDDPDAARLKGDLKERWNRWLVERYCSRERLAKAWTNAAGQCGLQDGEDPTKGNVEIPLPAHALGSWNRDYTKPTGAARASDALLFCYELQADYFLRMSAFLRSLGIRPPISGTNWHMQIRPNAKSNMLLGFTENHCYWDHAQPWGPGRRKFTRTNNSPMSRQNPAIGEGGLVDRLSRGAAPGKPFIVSEWNYDSPNEYRCEGPIQVAAYASLQDWDGVITYCFYGNWGDSWDKVEEAQALGLYLGSEEVYNDPPMICQSPVAAAMFLCGDVQAAKRLVHVGYSKVDTFYAQGKWGNETAHLAFLPFLHRVRHCYFEDEYAGDADVVVASGLSASGSYAKAKRAILACDNPSADLYDQSLGRQRLVAGLYPTLKFESHTDASVKFGEFVPAWQALKLPFEPGIRLDALASGAQPFGVDAQARVCLGFMDDRYCVAPGAFALGAADEAWFYRLFTAAMRRWGLRRDDQSQVGTLVSDTAELAWNSGDGVLTVNTPRTQAAVGFLGGRRIKLANVEIASRTPHCAITLTSLDGQPIGQSKRLLLTAVARAENTGQFWEDSSRRTVPAEGRGRAPVLVEPVEADVTIICDLAHAVCRALDASGAPKGAVPVAPGSRGFVLKLGKPHATVFYAIAHE